MTIDESPNWSHAAQLERGEDPSAVRKADLLTPKRPTPDECSNCDGSGVVCIPGLSSAHYCIVCGGSGEAKGGAS